MRRWRSAGYELEIIYLRLDSADIAVRRVAARVSMGGHHVPEVDVRRRFTRSWSNFTVQYQPLADRWWVFDVSGSAPILLEQQT